MKISFFLSLLILISLVSVVVYSNRREAPMPTPNPFADVSDSTSGDVVSSSSPSDKGVDVQLSVPDGFSISYFAKGISGPRALAFDPSGNLTASLTQDGRIVIFTGAENSMKTLLSWLRQPHGILFGKFRTRNVLYVAETDKVVRYDYDTGSIRVSNPRQILTLPRGGRHFTRSLLWLPDGRILVSVGSSCDACRETNRNRASIVVLNGDGTGVRRYATGLRNSVFMRTNPRTGEVWATEMGRDNLWDEIPPDEINIIKEGHFYGWPYCYGNKVTDKSFAWVLQRKTDAICEASVPAHVEIPAHSAPLWLAFVPDGWWAGYRSNLIVSYHGSWNRSSPTGYKVVRLEFDQNGNFTKVSDFVTGFLKEGKTIWRPVDALFASDGSLYISDDYENAIYRVTKN